MLPLKTMTEVHFVEKMISKLGVLSIFFFKASGINIFVSKYEYMIASLYNFEHYSKKSIKIHFN